MIYLDTSALVKKYVIEDGTENIRELLKTRRVFFTSKLTYAEVCASFARKQREGGIKLQHYENIWKSFLKDWESLNLIEINDVIFPIIRKTVETHFIRGSDAIHLSSAIWLGNNVEKTITFVVSDKRLLNAAMDEGLQVINPEKDA